MSSDIVGVLVHARPALVQDVTTQLIKHNGVEVHATEDDGRMVVTVEGESSQVTDTIAHFTQISGVLSASLIYHHFE